MDTSINLSKGLYARLQRQIAKLNTQERTLLTVMACIAITLVCINSFYSTPPYFSVSLNKIPEHEFHIVTRADNAYLITKIRHQLSTESPSLETSQLNSNEDGKNVGGSLEFQYLVFVVDSQYEHVLLPYKKHRYQSVSCPKLSLELNGFKYSGRFIDSGIRCLSPTERWKQDTFVYSLTGKSHNKFIADLYTPNFEVTASEIRISI